MFGIDPIIVLDADAIDWHIRLAAANIVNSDREARQPKKPSILDGAMPDYG